MVTSPLCWVLAWPSVWSVWTLGLVCVDTGLRCQRARSFLWVYVAETAKLGFEPQFVRIAGDPWETCAAGDTGRWVRR